MYRALQAVCLAWVFAAALPTTAQQGTPRLCDTGKGEFALDSTDAAPNLRLAVEAMSEEAGFLSSNCA